MRHWPDHVLGALADKALLLKRIAGAQDSGAEGDHPEQSVVVVSVNPNFVGEGCCHSAAAAAAMAAVAVMREVNLVTFLGDGCEVPIGAVQLPPWRVCRALEWRDGICDHRFTAANQRGEGETKQNCADPFRHGGYA
jgi:hypothetical protein